MKNKGFTLIELLVVISIISMLTSVILSSLNDARKKARDIQRIQSLVQLRNAIEMYYTDNGKYPTLNTNVDAAWNTDGNNTWSAWGANFNTALVGGKYINSLPQDPTHNNSNCPGYLGAAATCKGQAYFIERNDPNPKCYILGTNLENPRNNSLLGSWCGNYQLIGGNCTNGCKSFTTFGGSPI